MADTTAVYLEVETRDELKAQAKEKGMTLKGYLRFLANEKKKGK